jgi:neutral amino acid transport system permease protein
MDVSVFWIPAGYRPLVAFSVVILVLMFRPEGLAGKKSR